MARRPPRVVPGERYRRSPALVFYWTRRGPACFDCLTAQRSTIHADAVALLQRLDDWTSARDLAAGVGDTAANLNRLLEALTDRGLAERESTATGDWPWRDWMPEAALFHFGTRNRTYRTSPLDYERELRSKARTTPPPAATKSMAGARIALPPAAVDGSLREALLNRRTWRQFSRGAVTLPQLSSLLGLTFGVQQRASVTGQGAVVLKTSPSGGARHSIEAYVCALNVRGLAPGAYHYDAATHELVDLGRRVSRKALDHALAHQRWFLPAAAFVVMTSVVARVMWRYPSPRAYRAILIEAGHLGQTFCLLATALQLAPFCTIAFRDSELESIVGVDGVGETAVYVVGVGSRPARVVTQPGFQPRSRRR